MKTYGRLVFILKIEEVFVHLWKTQGS